MLHTKPQGHLVMEKKIFEGSLPYMGVTAILDVTQTPRTNFRFLIPLRLHMKFGFDSPSGFGEDISKWRTTDHGYTISLKAQLS